MHTALHLISKEDYSASAGLTFDTFGGARGWARVFFRICYMGGVNQPLGVPSLLLSLPPSLPFPSLPLFPLKPGGMLCESWGGINSPLGCGKLHGLSHFCALSGAHRQYVLQIKHIHQDARWCVVSLWWYIFHWVGLSACYLSGCFVFNFYW